MKPSVNYSDNMIKEISIRVLPQQAASETALKGFLAREFALNPKDIQAVRILKRSIDARKRQVIINLTVRIYLNELPPNDMFSPIIYGDVSDKQQAIVVGAGPAGLFAALRLIELGMRPIVLERGKDVHQRRKDIARISREHKVANRIIASEKVVREHSPTVNSIPVVKNADRSIVFYLFFVNTEPHSTYWPMPTLISEQISCLALSKISVIRFWNPAEK